MGKLIDADRLKDIIDYAILANVPADAENTKEEKWNDWIQTVIDRTPTVEAIPKADYEARLKADMVAMLTEIKDAASNICSTIWNCDSFTEGIRAYDKLIQQKIKLLKENNDEIGKSNK